MLAAKTTVPVLGVPVESRTLKGLDSLYSIVQMPRGIPVATFAIGSAGAANAALFAVAMLAAGDAALRAPPRRVPRAPDRGGAGDERRAEVTARRAAPAGGRRAAPSVAVHRAGRDARRHRRRPARPDVRARGAGDGLPHGGARSRSREPGRPGRARAHPRRATLDAAGARSPGRRAAPRSRPSSRTCRRPRSRRWPSAAGRARRRRRSSVCQDRAAEKAAFARSGVACAPHAAIAVERATSPRVDARAAARHPEDGAARLRRQGPAGGRLAAPRSPPPSRRSAASPACSRSACRSPPRSASSSRAARDGAVVHLPVQDNVHVGRHPRRHARAGARARHAGACRRGDRAAPSGSPRRSITSACCASSSSSSPTARCVANEMAPRPHNSGHYSIDACDVSQFELQVRAMTGVAAGRAAPALAVRDAEPARRPLAGRPRARLARRARAARRAPAPLRQGRGAARPQDGPPHAHRGERGRGRGGGGGGGAPARPGLRPRRRSAGAERCASTDSTTRRSSAPPPLIAAGELVAFPTETVYGLGARADERRRGREDLRPQGPAGRRIR